MKADFILHLADTNLILAQRLCEWCGKGPVLEQDIAISNIALDLLGQASYYYEYASRLGSLRFNADELAMLRTEREYKNLLLVELPNGHFGDTVARQFLYDAYHVLLLEQIIHANDSPELTGIAGKAVKEARYHRRWSSEWLIRLGDGTQESHQKMQRSLENLLPYVGEMFTLADYQVNLLDQGWAINPENFKSEWFLYVNKVLQEATLEPINELGFVQQGGKNGIHTEHMGYILAELQYMQRAYPNLKW